MRRLDRLVTQELKIDEQAATISRLSERVAELEGALRVFGTVMGNQQGICFCPVHFDGTPHWDRCVKANAALATPAPPTTNASKDVYGDCTVCGLVWDEERGHECPPGFTQRLGVTPNRQAKSALEQSFRPFSEVKDEFKAKSEPESEL